MEVDARAFAGVAALSEGLESLTACFRLKALASLSELLKQKSGKDVASIIPQWVPLFPSPCSTNLDFALMTQCFHSFSYLVLIWC